MAKQVVEALVEGGKATGGPPLGPALGPLGLNIKEVIDEINKKTSDVAGMKVPVKVIVDPSKKKYEIEVGTPPTSALIKKEANIEKGSKDGGVVGNISLEQLLKIVKIKRNVLLSNTLKGAVKEIASTCMSLKVNIEGISAKEFINELRMSR